MYRLYAYPYTKASHQSHILIRNGRVEERSVSTKEWRWKWKQKRWQATHQLNKGCLFVLSWGSFHFTEAKVLRNMTWNWRAHSCPPLNTDTTSEMVGLTETRTRKGLRERQVNGYGYMLRHLLLLALYPTTPTPPHPTPPHPTPPHPHPTPPREDQNAPARGGIVPHATDEIRKGLG